MKPAQRSPKTTSLFHSLPSELLQAATTFQAAATFPAALFRAATMFRFPVRPSVRLSVRRLIRRPLRQPAPTAALAFLFLFAAFSPISSEAGTFGTGGDSAWKTRIADADSVFGSVADSVFTDCLSRLLIEPSGLSFDRCRAEDDTFRLDIAAEALSNPFALPAIREYLTEQAPDSSGTLADFLPSVWDCLGVPSDRPNPGKLIEDALASDGGIPGAATVTAMSGILEEAAALLRAAFTELTPGEKTRLLASAPVFFANEEEAGVPRKEPDRFGELNLELGLAAPDSFAVSSDSLLNWSLKVDAAPLADAGALVLAACEALAEAAAPAGPGAGSLVNSDPPADAAARQLNAEAPPVTAWKALDAAAWPSPRGRVRGPVLLRVRTAGGDIVVGGCGPNSYDGRFALIIDTGGDDIYRGGAAGAVGAGGCAFEAGTAQETDAIPTPVSAVIDLGGNDLYDTGDVSFSCGAAVMGVGILIDVSGDDTYRCGPCSQGAGLFGCGFLVDAGDGDDVRTSGFFSQGAGCAGVGTLFDAGGNDFYIISDFGQGCGGVFGFGGLLDSGGNDVYRAGGVYTHAPLLPEDYRSFAQGFAIGFRPRAGGGVGFLLDRAGNDFYDAEVFAQACAYWYSVGILADLGGNDHYSATQYAQGSGIHLAAGHLYDAGGRDHYFSRFGPSQGTAHDFAVGVLHDREGDDRYLVGGGQGLSLTNSVAVFIDGAGNDHYSATETNAGHGISRPARGFEGAGFFIDIEGDDTYDAGSPGSDASIWRQAGWGIGVDLDRDIILPEEELPEIVLTEEDTLKSLEDIFGDASLWEVGNNREKVRRARMALEAKGLPAVEYVLTERLDTRSGLELRAIEELAKAYPDSTSERAAELLDSENDRIRGNAVWLIGRLECPGYSLKLSEMLAEKRNKPLRGGILQSLGRLGDASTSTTVEPFLESKAEKIRITAAESLGRLKNGSSIPSLLDAVEDPAFVVRSAAGSALSRFDAEIVLPFVAGRIEKNTHDNTASLREHARLCRKLYPGLDPEKDRSLRTRLRDALMPLLDSEHPGLRAAAAGALAVSGSDIADQRLKILSENETDPMVRNVLKDSSIGEKQE